jgi:hypothetical protein
MITLNVACVDAQHSTVRFDGILIALNILAFFLYIPGISSLGD